MNKTSKEKKSFIDTKNYICTIKRRVPTQSQPPFDSFVIGNIRPVLVRLDVKKRRRSDLGGTREGHGVGGAHVGSNRSIMKRQ